MNKKGLSQGKLVAIIAAAVVIIVLAFVYGGSIWRSITGAAIAPLTNETLNLTLNNTPKAPADLVAPSVVSVNPSDGASDVLLNPMISIKLSEELDEKTVTEDSVYLLESAIKIEGKVVYKDKTIIFKPVNALNSYSVFTIVLTTDIRDLADNPLASEYRSSFRTMHKFTNPAGGGSSPGSNTRDTTAPKVVDSPESLFVTLKQ